MQKNQQLSSARINHSFYHKSPIDGGIIVSDILCKTSSEKNAHLSEMILAFSGILLYIHEKTCRSKE